MGWSQLAESTADSWPPAGRVNSVKERNIWRIISQECLKWRFAWMRRSSGAFVVILYIPVWALQTGLLSIEGVDEVSILLADVSKAGVVGGCVRGERPVVHVGHCGKCVTHTQLIITELAEKRAQIFSRLFICSVSAVQYLEWSCSSCPPWSPAGSSHRSAGDWTSCPASRDSSPHLRQETLNEPTSKKTHLLFQCTD